MTKSAILLPVLFYAATATAGTVNNVQDAPELGRYDLSVTRPPRGPVRAAWSSVFMLYVTRADRRAEYGTAFVTFNQRVGNRRRLQLVTVDHALAANCDQHRCRNVQIHADGRVEGDAATNRRRFLTDELEVGELTVLKRDAALDLAIIEINVDAAVDPKPLLIGNTPLVRGQDAWLIAYPNVFKGRADLRLDHPNLIARRFARGITIGNATLDATETLHASNDARDLITLTVAAAPGASGGPILDDDGVVVGVLDWAALGSRPEIASAAINLNDLREFLSLGAVGY